MGVCRPNFCEDVSAFMSPFDMQHDIVLKKLNFDPLTPRVRGMGVGGSAG